MSRTFVIADTHFTHKNIIGFCQRPFNSVEEMDAELIKRWNDTVTPDDIVIHIGDVFWNKGTAKKIAPKLNGAKYVVRGNHDWSIEFMQSLGFHCLTRSRDGIHQEYRDDLRIIMAHRPRDLPTWYAEGKNPNAAKGSFVAFQEERQRTVILCGHEHNNAPIFIKWVRDIGDKARPIMALNMSCEYWDYKPTLLEEVVETYLTMLGRHL